MSAKRSTEVDRFPCDFNYGCSRNFRLSYLFHILNKIALEHYIIG